MEFDGQRLTAVGINHCPDTRGVNSTSVDQVVNRTISTALSLAFARTPDGIVAGGAGLLLELDCEVVETCLLIVEAQVVVLVEDTALRNFRRRDRERAATCAVAVTV
jgi:hypothetical protein